MISRIASVLQHGPGYGVWCARADRLLDGRYVEREYRWPTVLARVNRLLNEVAATAR